MHSKEQDVSFSWKFVCHRKFSALLTLYPKLTNCVIVSMKLECVCAPTAAQRPLCLHHYAVAQTQITSLAYTQTCIFSRSQDVHQAHYQRGKDQLWQIMPRRLSGYAEIVLSINDLPLLTVSRLLHDRSFYMMST